MNTFRLTRTKLLTLTLTTALSGVLPIASAGAVDSMPTEPHESRPMPSTMPCAEGPAAKGKTTVPGSPGTQGGKPAGTMPCSGSATTPTPGKTTEPGSRGTQGGAKPIEPPPAR